MTGDVYRCVYKLQWLSLAALFPQLQRRILDQSRQLWQMCFSLQPFGFSQDLSDRPWFTAGTALQNCQRFLFYTLQKITVLSSLIWFSLTLLPVLSAVQVHVAWCPSPPPTATVHPADDGLLHRSVTCLRSQTPPDWRVSGFRAGSSGGLLHSEYTTRNMYSSISAICVNTQRFFQLK